jgi:endonuclease/exonuclease/phosphatase family metal-dependent hydrolase
MSTRLRILSCNLFSGRANADALTELIEKMSIDLVCAQELSVELAQSISALLPYGDMSHDQIHRGNGIASRYPVATDRIRMPKRDGWVARLSPRNWQKLPCPIEVVNVHISGPHLWPYFPRLVRRKAQLEALLEDSERRTGTPHAIFGDFNSSPIWPVYKKMSARFVDGARESGISELGFKGTWPYLPWLGIRGLLRIDHCFLWKLSAKRARILEIPGSDHLGLLVDIDISEQRFRDAR